MFNDYLIMDGSCNHSGYRILFYQPIFIFLFPLSAIFADIFCRVMDFDVHFSVKNAQNRSIPYFASFFSEYLIYLEH